MRNKANDKGVCYLLLENNYITTDQKSNYNEISFMLCNVVEFEILNYALVNSKRHWLALEKIEFGIKNSC
jgi:hypothetical protein